MCGIAGLVADRRPEELKAVIEEMTLAIERRGPDSSGVHLWPGVAFGHRRLAIIDVSPLGHQPMLTPDGQVGVVFNGCIYNFLELRRELEGSGCVFRSQCDTEVLLHGYQTWGAEAMARRLRGMFAFGVWDNRRRSLTLVRDRLGVKPLVYREVPGGLAFGSTVGAVCAAGPRPDIDPQAVLEFLEWGYVTGERAIYNGFLKLPPGHLLEWRDGQSQVTSYWELPIPDPGARVLPFAEAVEQTEHLLLESVRLRLMADVPIGSLLSAGIDSTLICWATAKLNADIRAFTVSTPGDPADEAPAATSTARLLGLRHEVVTLSERQEDSLDELTAAFDEPFACSSAMAMLRVSRAIKPLATVLLTGDGGDDIFLGYPYHRNYWLAQRMATRSAGLLPGAWRAARPLIQPFDSLRRPKHLLDYATGGLGAVTRVHDGLPYYQKNDILGERLTGRSLKQREIPLSAASGRRLLPEMLAYEHRMQFGGEFLPKVDGATMHFALEARSPLLDQTLWEFAASLPIATRLHDNVPKAILREIVRRRVSPEVATRKKQGFTIPVERWLVSRWSDGLRALTSDSLLAREKWIRAGSLQPAVQKAIANQWAPQQLWHLIVLENWLRKSRVGSLHALPA